MSQEFQLAWRCPHQVVEEFVPLGADRCSLRTKQPVANANTVRVMVNNEYFIPNAGLYSQAVLMSALSGPFDIRPDENTITLRASGGEYSYTFDVRQVTRYTATEVAQLFQQDGIDVAYVEAYNGHLSFTDVSSMGTSSFVEIGGSAAASFGFGANGTNLLQRRARGKQLYPPWQLQKLPGFVGKRYPVFMEPVQTNPVFKVTYAMSARSCLRCGGTLVENDIRFDSSGQSLMIENEDLLYQAALKIILTVRGSNPYHPWYGATLQSRVGSKALAGVSTVINEDVRKALARYQTLQVEQAKYQQVTYKERMYSVDKVDVYPHQQDPSTFMIDVVVRNASSKPIHLSIVYTTPGTVALMGSNGLMLGTEAVGIESGLFPFSGSN